MTDAKVDPAALAERLERAIAKTCGLAANGVCWTCGNHPSAHLAWCPDQCLRDALTALRQRSQEETPKQPNPCPVCGAYLWDDPRPCWNCARLKAQEETPAIGERGTCAWIEDSDGMWHTQCDNAFQLNTGTPRDNKMAFCGYCGKILAQAEHQPRDGDGQ